MKEHKKLHAVKYGARHGLAALGVCLMAWALAACASSGEGEAKAFKGEAGAEAFKGEVGALVAEEASRPEFLTASGIDCGAGLLTQFDVAAAATAPVLLDDLQAGTLGEDGASAQAADVLGGTGSLCDVTLRPDTQAIVEEAVALGEGGQGDEALALLNGHLQALAAGAGAGGGHLAAPALYDTADRQTVKSIVVMQALAQQYGGTEAGTEYGEAARMTLRNMAERDLPTAGWEEALLIQKDAQILGDGDLAEEAAIRVGEAVDEELAAELAAFNPCTATEEATNILGYRIANALGMGRNADLVSEARVDWTKALEILGKRRRGEDVPECGEPLAFEWTHTHGGGMVTSGSAFTCDGEAWHIDFALVWVSVDFTADTTGALDFQVIDGATGSLQFPTEGTITVPGAGELIVEDPLDFSLTLHDDGQTASLFLNSTGAGIMYAPATADDPDSMGTIFPGEDIAVTLVPYEGCGSQ